jgi:trehalose/maltose hydrolase-like predicted phosphorylase
LGLDADVDESVLVPQVMLYGFMGFEPTATGFKLNPRLPEAWPALQITGIQIHDSILTIASSRDDITVTQTNTSAKPLTVDLPSTFARLSYGEPIKLDQDVPVRSTRKE